MLDIRASFSESETHFYETPTNQPTGFAGPVKPHDAKSR
jgi:hypothetical protein